MILRPTASSLDRLMACPTSAVLPGRDVPTKWGERGNAIHQFRALRAKTTEQMALAQIAPEFRDACRHLVLDALPPSAEHEVAFAYDVATGKARRLEGCADRDYDAFDLRPFETPGTADVVYVDGDTVVVIDYKSAYGKRIKPEYSPTMMFYGLCAWKVSGAAKCQLVYRNTDMGRDYVSELDAMDFLPFEDELRTLHQTIAQQRALGAEADRIEAVREGEHCRYCPAQMACPAKRALVAAVQSGSLKDRVELSIVGNLDDDRQFQEAFQLWRMLELITKRMRDIIHARAKSRPGPTRPGYEYGQRETRGRETLDGDVVYDVLAEMFNVDVATEATTCTTTKDAMKLALKDAVERGGVAAAMRNVLKAVRDRGGATRTKPGVKFEEYAIQALEVAK